MVVGCKLWDTTALAVANAKLSGHSSLQEQAESQHPSIMQLMYNSALQAYSKHVWHLQTAICQHVCDAFFCIGHTVSAVEDVLT